MRAEAATTKSYIDQRSSLNRLRNTLSGQKNDEGLESTGFSKSFGGIVGRAPEYENKVQQRHVFNYQERPVEQPQIIYSKRSSQCAGIENQYEKLKAQVQDIGKTAYKLPQKSLKDNYICFQQTSTSSKNQSRSVTPGTHPSQQYSKRYQGIPTQDRTNTLNIVEKHLSQLKEIQNITGPQNVSKRVQPTHTSSIRDQRPPLNRLSTTKRLKTQSSSKSFSSISSQKTTVSSFKENENSSASESPHQDSNLQQNSSKNSLKIVGLKNLGNTCFMNSILQCVFATHHLSRYFLGGYFEKQQGQAPRVQPLAKSYFHILQKIYSSSSQVLVPSELKHVMGKKSSQFAGYSQQDAQEFLRCLVDAMHEELNRVSQKPPYKEIDFEKYSWSEQADGWWKYNKQREDSIIGDIFEGQLMSKIQCQKCGFASLAFDNFMDLSIPIPKKKIVTLGDCLDDFIYDEVMEKCGYKCKKCHREDNFKKQMTIWRFPKVIVIHLKRFQNTYLRREKLNTYVDIPLEIDLQDLAPHSIQIINQKNRLYMICMRYPTTQVLLMEDTMQRKIYQLKPHIRDVKAGNNKWYRCNDATLSKISMAYSKQSQSAYVLFYQMKEQSDQNHTKL